MKASSEGKSVSELQTQSILSHHCRGQNNEIREYQAWYLNCANNLLGTTHGGVEFERRKIDVHKKSWFCDCLGDRAVKRKFVCAEPHRRRVKSGHQYFRPA